MKSLTLNSATDIPRRFDQLNAMFPLRPIVDETDLDNANKVMDRLAVLSRRTKDQEDYLQSLITLSEKYEADEIADALDRTRSTGADALKYLLKLQNISQVELAKILKIRPSAVSMIVSGQRPITANHARVLARRFSLSTAVFIG